MNKIEKIIYTGTSAAWRPFFVLLILILGMPFYFAGSAASFEVPELTGRVVDTVDLFQPEEERQIENAILTLENETGGQMAVVTLAPLQNTSIEEAGLAVLNGWGIGRRGKDNGAVFIIIPESKKMRLEIGYGWEGAVPDARAGDLIRNAAPFFRKNRYADGVTAAIDGLRHAVVTGEMPTPPANAADEKLTLPEMIFTCIMTLFISLLIFLGLLQRLFAYLAKKWSSPFFASLSFRLQKLLRNSDKSLRHSSRDSSSGGSFSGRGSSGGGFSGGGGRSGGGGASGGW